MFSVCWCEGTCVAASLDGSSWTTRERGTTLEVMGHQCVLPWLGWMIFLHEAQVVLAEHVVPPERASSWPHSCRQLFPPPAKPMVTNKGNISLLVFLHIVAGPNYLGRRSPRSTRGMGECTVGGATASICTTPMVRNTSITSEGVVMKCANCSIGVLLRRRKLPTPPPPLGSEEAHVSNKKILLENGYPFGVTSPPRWEDTT